MTSKAPIPIRSAPEQGVPNPPEPPEPPRVSLPRDEFTADDRAFVKAMLALADELEAYEHHFEDENAASIERAFRGLASRLRGRVK